MQLGIRREIHLCSLVFTLVHLFLACVGTEPCAIDLHCPYGGRLSLRTQVGRRGCVKNAHLRSNIGRRSGSTGRRKLLFTQSLKWHQERRTQKETATNVE